MELHRYQVLSPTGEEFEDIKDDDIYQSEIINTLSSINKEYNLRLNCCKTLSETLSTIHEGKDALTARLEKAVQEVQDLKQSQVEWGDQRQLLIDTLQDKVRLNDEHRAEMLQQLSTAQSARQQAEAEVRELKDKLEEVLRDKELLDRKDMELKQKLRSRSFVIKNLLQEQRFNTRNADANRRQLEQQNEMPCHSRSNDAIDEGCSSQNNKKRKK